MNVNISNRQNSLRRSHYVQAVTKKGEKWGLLKTRIRKTLTRALNGRGMLWDLYMRTIPAIYDLTQENVKVSCLHFCF